MEIAHLLFVVDQKNRGYETGPEERNDLLSGHKVILVFWCFEGNFECTVTFKSHKIVKTVVVSQV